MMRMDLRAAARGVAAMGLALLLGACGSGPLMMGGPTTAAGDPLPRAEPEAVGMSSAALARIDRHVTASVDQGRIPGMVIAIAREGKLVYFKAFGWRDKAAGVAMTTDSIFPLASMTKPWVSVATMELVEEGRVLLGDPVARYIPEMARMQVAANRGAASATGVIDTVPPRRPPSVQDLLRHTSGLLYGGRGTTALHKLYPPSSAYSGSNLTSAQFIEKIGGLHLAYQPGTVWDYSLATDVLGILVERVEQRPLSAVLQERIFGPLRMVDSGFMVPADKAARIARPLPVDPVTKAPVTMHDFARPLAMECGGGCGTGTASDYVRFAQMLLNRGTLDGVRVLMPKTVDAMTTDHLGPDIENNIMATEPHRHGYGFGLGFAVRRQMGGPATLGSAGDYFWNGAYGTSFWVDPRERLVVVAMLQAPGNIETRQHYRQVLASFVYAAIER